jgi:hypothetical protein
MKQARAILWVVALLCAFSSISLQGQENHSPDSDKSVVVVPAGTNITVEFKYPQHDAPHTYEGKVVWPVRVGFTTAVPVGTMAKVYVSTRYYNDSTADVAKVTSIVLDGREYLISTDERAVAPGFEGEVRFTLTAELKIKQ